MHRVRSKSAQRTGREQTNSNTGVSGENKEFYWRMPHVILKIISINLWAEQIWLIHWHIEFFVQTLDGNIVNVGQCADDYLHAVFELIPLMQ